jgi:hypothetical protein
VTMTMNWAISTQQSGKFNCYSNYVFSQCEVNFQVMKYCSRNDVVVYIVVNHNKVSE